MNNSDTKTSITLLMRISSGRDDVHAWNEFVKRYEPLIRGWCKGHRLQAVDIDDVAQNVMVKLANRMASFDYDPIQSFRGWLRRVTENALNDFHRAKWQVPQGGSGVRELLASTEASQDLLERLNAAFDLELLELAIARVRQRVSADRFAAWDLLANHGLDGRQIADRLGMKVATVYTAKNQVQKLLAEEIAALEHGQAGIRTKLPRDTDF